MKTTLFSLLLVAFGSLISCGEPTDRPEDCNPNEFFDEARSLCLSCPAVAEPTCDDSCGFDIAPNERGCPAATCRLGDVCGECPALEFYSKEAMGCQPCSGPTECNDGTPTVWVDGGVCTLQCL